MAYPHYHNQENIDAIQEKIRRQNYFSNAALISTRVAQAWS